MLEGIRKMAEQNNCGRGTKSVATYLDFSGIEKYSPVPSSNKENEL